MYGICIFFFFLWLDQNRIFEISKNSKKTLEMEEQDFQLQTEEDDHEMEDEEQQEEEEQNDAVAIAASVATTAAGATEESKRWMQSLEKCIRAIVSIRLLSVRAFDGNGASFSVATGFVVDKERGIILTNRHVVTPGPVRADAIFLNKEEVDLIPIYR